MESKIYNPASGRYVSPMGRIGKKLSKTASPKRTTKKKTITFFSPIKITSPKKLSKGSKESIDILIDVACDELPAIEKSKLLGKGGEGSVYLHCILNKCDYAVKVQHDDKDPHGPPLYDILRKEMEITNIAHKAGLAPKIYKVLKCDDKILTLMDLVKGRTLRDAYPTLKSTTVDRLIDAIGRLHQIGIYHSDISPMNIFIDDKDNITFIDFGIRNKKYLMQYDFASLLYYMPSYEKLNINITAYIYSEIIRILREYNDAVSKRIVKMWENEPAKTFEKELRETDLYKIMSTQTNDDIKNFILKNVDIDTERSKKKIIKRYDSIKKFTDYVETLDNPFGPVYILIMLEDLKLWSHEASLAGVLFGEEE